MSGSRDVFECRLRDRIVCAVMWTERRPSCLAKMSASKLKRDAIGDRICGSNYPWLLAKREVDGAMCV